MKESMGHNHPPANNYSSEGRLLMDDLIETMGLSREELHRLPADEKREILAKIKEVYQSPDVQTLLVDKKSDGLLTSEAQTIRESIGLDKWNKLSEIVSYVKTLLGEKTQEERSEIFSKHLAFGVDANEIQHTLTRIHDVMPARIDTDIKHQSSLFYRAVVEVASNALDASIKHRSPIGRFGVGFYQILNHLNDPKDKVVVKTKSADVPVGIKIEFRNKGGEIVIKVSEDKSVSEQGTTVELSSKEFEADKAEKIIREYFSHTQDAELVINGKNLERWKPDGGAETLKDLPVIDIRIEDGKCTVVDKGIGMPPRVIFEKLLVPKLSEKPPVYELREKGKTPPRIYFEKSHSDAEHSGEILIQVGGIVIEKEKCKGVRVANTLVIDLPPSTILGEQRDEVEVNGDTVEAMRDAVDQAMKLPKPECFEVINSLGVACRKFQNRSKLYKQEDNMYVYLQNKLRESFPDVHFLPNTVEFLELDLGQDVAFLDPTIYQSPINSIPGLKKVSAWASKGNISLYETKFKKESTLGIITAKNFLIVDEEAKVLENPEIMNKVITLAAGWGKGSISEVNAREPEKKEREIKQFESLEDMVVEQWEHFSFNSKEIALRQARLYQNKNPQVTEAFTKKILSKLHTVGAAEAWDILHWYVNGDKRSVNLQLEEVEQLAKNIDAILGNPKVAEILQSNGVPILSMFESYNAEIPTHIAKDRHYSKNEINIDGKKYVKSNTSESNHSRFIAEDGSFVDMDGPGEIRFRNSEITVYKDKIVNTQTGEILDPSFPIQTPWGDVKQVGQVSPKNYGFYKSDSIKNQENAGAYNNKVKDWSIDYSGGNSDPSIYLEGNKIANLNEVRRKAGIGQLELKNILKTESGDPILFFNNFHEGRQDTFYYGDRYSSNEEEKEQFYMVNKEGEVIWSFSSIDWPNKVSMHEKYAYHGSRGEGPDSQDIEFVKENEQSAAQCLPITYDRAITEKDPVIKIVNYHFINSGRFRETVAYINSKGDITHISETDEVNSITLDAKYSSESSCPCCGLQCEFSKSRYSPYVNGTEESPIKSLVRLPVEIIGEFKYNPEEEHWLALAREGENSNEGNLYMAIFDKQGQFLNTEKIGYSPQIIHDEFDFRNQEKHLRHRLPDRLRDIDFKDKNESYWTYEGEIRKFITLGDRVLLNRRVGQRYGSSYEPELQEVDNVTRGIFDTKKGAISEGQMKVMEEYLLKFTVPDKEKLERVAYRVLEFRQIPEADLGFLLPVLYESDYLPPNFFNPEMLTLLRKVSYLDAERFTKLFTIIKGSVPDDGGDKLKITEKIIKFYAEKFQSESLEESDNLIYSLSNVKEYSNAVKCNGFTLIKYNVSVPPAEISRSLRPFVTFIQREEDELAYKNLEVIKVPENPPRTIKLSEIIQWKRLRESEARKFDGGITFLDETVRGVVHGKSREHIVREITHAVHFQALNSTDLYVRELIQNAVDVMQSMNMDKAERNIEITASATDDNELVTSFKDPVGMSMSTVLNYFLVPGESTKLDRSKDFIGFYGQGVYTLFKDFKVINIKTSTGDGKTLYMTIHPVEEHGMINDVSIDFRSSEENFKGTVISKRQHTDNPYIEASYVKDSVMTLTSALSDDRASVLYQKEKINTDYKILSEKKVEKLGNLTIYKNPNNIVTQHGLYIKDIGAEYYGLIPSFMNKSLKDWGGLAIDFPKGVELTRSRQDIANKDKVQEILNPEIQKGLVNAYFEGFKEKMESGEVKFPLDSLPYDYFSEGQNYELPYSYKEDAEALLKGEPLKHLDEYVDSNKALKLMSLLPFFKVKDQMVSLDTLRKVVISKEEPPSPFNESGWKDRLPSKLVELMSVQKADRAMRQAQQAEAMKDAIRDTTLEDIFSQAEGELKEWLIENKDKLEDLDKLTQEFMVSVNEGYDRHSRGLFHYSRTGEIAHARRQGDLSWNLDYIKGSGYKNALKEIEEFRGQKGGKISNLLESLETLAHEYGHIIEDYGAWTHDSKHEKEQGRILIQFLIHNGPKRLLEALRPAVI